MKYCALLSMCLSLQMCVTMGGQIDESKVDQIKACQTTETELISLFGEPYQRGNQNGIRTMKWMYREAGIGGLQKQNLFVMLNQKRIVTQFQLNPAQEPTDLKDTCK